MKHELTWHQRLATGLTNKDEYQRQHEEFLVRHYPGGVENPGYNLNDGFDGQKWTVFKSLGIISLVAGLVWMAFS